jgi:hypothetical protein
MLKTDRRDDPRFAFFESCEGKAGDNIVIHLDFQPGNGTRYHTVFTELETGDVVVSRITAGFGQCMTLNAKTDNLLHYAYLKEKLRIRSDADAAALLLLISLVTTRTVVFPDKFDVNAEWDDKSVEIIVSDGVERLLAATA